MNLNFEEGDKLQFNTNWDEADINTQMVRAFAQNDYTGFERALNQGADIYYRGLDFIKGIMASGKASIYKALLNSNTFTLEELVKLAFMFHEFRSVECLIEARLVDAYTMVDGEDLLSYSITHWSDYNEPILLIRKNPESFDRDHIILAAKHGRKELLKFGLDRTGATQETKDQILEAVLKYFPNFVLIEISITCSAKLTVEALIYVLEHFSQVFLELVMDAIPSIDSIERAIDYTNALPDGPKKEMMLKRIDIIKDNVMW